MIESARCGADSDPKRPRDDTRRSPWPTPAAGKTTPRPRGTAGVTDDEGWWMLGVAWRANRNVRYERLVLKSLPRIGGVREVRRARRWTASSAGTRLRGCVVCRVRLRLREEPCIVWPEAGGTATFTGGRAEIGKRVAEAIGKGQPGQPAALRSCYRRQCRSGWPAPHRTRWQAGGPSLSRRPVAAARHASRARSRAG